MDFVDGHGRAPWIGFAAAIDPVCVAPLMFGLPNDGRVFGWGFAKGRVRISFERDVSEFVADFEFVVRALLDTGDKNFPDAGRAERTHGVIASVPAIPIADD